MVRRKGYIGELFFPIASVFVSAKNEIITLLLKNKEKSKREEISEVVFHCTVVRSLANTNSNGPSFKLFLAITNLNNNFGVSTGKSLSEAPIFAPINLQYDNRLFMELP